MPGDQMAPDGARHHIARLELGAALSGHEARRRVSSMSTAPSPRTASLTSGIGSQPASSAVGWNCTNSMSASTAPARAASAMPWPIAPSGLVVWR